MNKQSYNEKHRQKTEANTNTNSDLCLLINNSYESYAIEWSIEVAILCVYNLLFFDVFIFARRGILFSFSWVREIIVIADTKLLFE